MKGWTLIVAAAVLLPVTAWAQADADRDRWERNFTGPSAGSREVTLSGTGTNDNDFDSGSFGISGSYGWYVDRNLEVSLRQTINWADIGGDGSFGGSTRLAVDWHFDLGRWRPFIGANIGMVYGEDVNDTGIIGPEVGVKYFVNNTTFVLAQTEYQYFWDKGSEITDNFDDGAFVHTIGLGFIF